jgi:hypothetical protein
MEETVAFRLPLNRTETGPGRSGWSTKDRCDLHGTRTGLMLNSQQKVHHNHRSQQLDREGKESKCPGPGAERNAWGVECFVNRIFVLEVQVMVSSAIGVIHYQHSACCLMHVRVPTAAQVS